MRSPMAMDHHPVRWGAIRKQKSRGRKAFRSADKLRTWADRTEYPSMQTSTVSRIENSDEKMNGDCSKISAMLSRTGSPQTPVIHRLKNLNEGTLESLQEEVQLVAGEKRDSEEAGENSRTNSTNSKDSVKIHINPGFNKLLGLNNESNSSNLEHNNSFSECGSDSDSGVAEQESIIISDSDPEQSTPSVSTTPEKLDLMESHSKLHQTDGKEDCIPGLRRVSKQSYGLVKRARSNVIARRKAFRLLSLRNTHRGSRLHMKNSLKRGRVGKETRRTSPVFTVSSLGADGVPMEVLVKKKLNFVFEDLSSPANAPHKAATPVNPKFNFVSSDTSAQNVVSCQLPCDVSSDTGPSEQLYLRSKEVEDPQKGFISNKKDVCYIYAVLNGEKEEALYKCSPQFKSSRFLQQITSVIETIAADDDVIVSHKVDSSGAAVSSQKAPMIDRATSPIVGFEPPETVVADGEAQGSDAHQPTNEPLVVVNTTLKVLLSKALLSFTSELKIIVDVSMRLLSWCSAPIRVDIDSDMVEDELEAFFCLSHDQVSILLECLSLLDSKQILNVDEVELERFWLLHDALCCMLQVYRYLQSSFLSSSIDQQLLSVLSTCSKLILPTSKLSVEKWADLMKMVCGIGSKLNESECFSDPCKCHQCLASLRINRCCRVCDVSRLHQTLCSTRNSANPVKGPIEEFKGSPSNRPVLEQLFPRFCFFLNSIEEWSEEEFKNAIAKHSVVKFSCNVDSGLNPCNLHLSEIVCRCFASHAPVSASEVDPPCLNIDSGHSSSPDTSEQQNSVPKLCEDKRSPSVEKPALEHNNAEDVDLHISSSSDSTSHVLNGEGKPDEISSSQLPSDDEGKNCQVQEDTSTKSTETIILDGSSSSADNFTLRIGQSSSETDQDSLSRNRSELEESKTDDSTNMINSSGCIESALKYVVPEENSDSASENSLSIIPPSSEYSTNGSQSDLMKPVSIGDESAFECSRSSEDLAREESLRGNKGSFGSSGTTQDNSDVSKVQKNGQAGYAESSEAEGLSGDIVSSNSGSNYTSTACTSPTEETELDSSSLMPGVVKRMLHGLNHNAVHSKSSPQLFRFEGPHAVDRCMEKDCSVRFTQAPGCGNCVSRMETNMSGNTKSVSDREGRRGLKLPESKCTEAISNGIVNHEEIKNLKSKKEVNQKNVKSFEGNRNLANFQRRNGRNVSVGGALTSSSARQPKPHKKLQLRKKVNVNSDRDQKQSEECQAVLYSEKQVAVDKDAGGPTNDSLQEIRKEKEDCVAEKDDLNQKHQISDSTYREAFVMADKNDKSELYNCVEGGKKGKKRVKFAMDCKPVVGCGKTARKRNSGFTGFTVPKKETKLSKGLKECMEEEVERNHSSTFLNSGTKVSHSNSKIFKKEKDSKKISVDGSMYMSDLHKENGASHCSMAADRHRTLANADGHAGSQSAFCKRRYAVDQISLMSPNPKRNGAECNFAERKSLLPQKLKTKTASEEILGSSTRIQKTKRGNTSVPCINDNTDSKMNLPEHKKSKKADPSELDNAKDWESAMERMRERYLRRPTLSSDV